MINNTYLNHKFMIDEEELPYLTNNKLDNDGIYYYCDVCKIKIVYWRFDSSIGTDKYVIKYSMKTDNRYLNFTCDEWLIKCIIE